MNNTSVQRSHPRSQINGPSASPIRTETDAEAHGSGDLGLTTDPILLFGTRLLVATFNGNVGAFEQTVEEYRVLKGCLYIGGDEGESHPTTPARGERGRRHRPSMPPALVDEASRELLSYPLQKRDISAPALFWAGYAGHSCIISHIQRSYEAVFVEQCCRVSKQLMDHHKDLAAVSLLVRNGTPAAIINEARGETALHRLVRRTKPNAALINELLKTYRKPSTAALNTTDGDEGNESESEEEPDDVDALNNDGYSALHLVALLSKGTDGRSAAQVLLAHGADILCPAGNGKGNARTIAQNPHVRAILSYKNSASPVADEETRRKIDSCKSVHDLPPLPETILDQPKASDAAESRLNPQAATEEEKSMQMRTLKKLSKEEVEGVVRRLHDQSLQMLEEKSAARRHALEPTESRRLTQEEQEAVADRLCYESMEERAAKREELLEKYLVEHEPTPLDSDQQAESVARLCDQSLERKKAHLQTLDERYWPADRVPRRVLTSEEVKACASRLHDASNEHTREKFEKLAAKYLASDTNKKKLSPSERSEARSRLYQGK